MHNLPAALPTTDEPAELDLDALEALARGATPGPYRHNKDAEQIGEVAGPDGHALLQVQAGLGQARDMRADHTRRDRDAAFFAALSPQVVLQLIEAARHAAPRPATSASETRRLALVDESFPSHPEFKQPRPKLMRFCTIELRSTCWPDQGQGVWKIVGFDNMGTREEVFVLKRVMPAYPGGPTGEEIRFWRASYEGEGLAVWRKDTDLLDPEYAVSRS